MNGGEQSTNARVSQTRTEEQDITKKKKQAHPAGWDEARVRRFAEQYDHQTDDEQVAEHEAAFRAEGQTVMVVPSELVPEIVKLISKPAVVTEEVIDADDEGQPLVGHSSHAGSGLDHPDRRTESRTS
jgi:hypothetical protein